MATRFARMLALAAWLVPAAAHAQPALAPTATESSPAPAPSPWTFHHGPTFEVNVGLGRLYQPFEYGDGIHPAFGGPDVSLGGWLTRRLALTWRVAGIVSNYQSDTKVHVVVGPSAQLWLTESLWVGATAGRAFVRSTGSTSHDGWGYELRAGVTLNQGSASTVNLSLALTPGFYSEDDIFTDGTGQVRFTGLVLLAGYQYL